MRRLTVLVLAAGLVAGAGAYPGTNAGRGLLRVQDARSLGNWYGTLMLHGTHTAFPWAALPDSAKPYVPEDGGLQVTEGLAAVSLSPVEYFELFAWGGGIREYATGQDSAFWGYHGLNPGLKLSLPLLPVVKLGASGTYSVYPVLNDYRGEWYYGNFGFPLVNGPAWNALATFALPEISKWAPTVHLNFGQAYDSYVRERGVGGDTTIKTTVTTISGAVEYPIDKLDLFVEFYSQQAGGAIDPLGDNGRAVITPGIKVGYLRPLVIQAGAAIGLNDKAPAIEVIAGLGVSGRLFTPPKPTTGTIAGKVVDAATGRALAATVGLPDEAKPTIVSADGKGMFSLKRVRAGMVRVKASAPGYIPAEREVQVTAGRTQNIELALGREQTTGSIAGKVTDPVTGAPLAARVSLDGADAKPVDADGSFRFDDLEAGDYTLEASADGYLTATAQVSVAAKQEVRSDIQLVKAGVKITLKVYFDFDKAELRPESYQALADAAKIMKENPGIKVEIQGHTDDVGTAEYNQRLSLERAQAVIDYLVGKLGVEAGRLTAKGFGLTRPVGPSGTEEGRALNRRVEFLVLE